MQSLMNAGDKHYDIIELVGQNGETKTIYFDISSWFGKMSRRHGKLSLTNPPPR